MRHRQWYCVMESLGVPFVHFIELQPGVNKNVNCLFASKTFDHADEFRQKIAARRETLLRETIEKNIERRSQEGNQ